MPKCLLGSHFASVFLGVLAWTASCSHGQDLMGVLPEMLKPEVAELLGLSDEQRDEVQELIGSRTSAAIGLSQALREAPRSQHDSLREEFRQESETLALDLLEPQQQAKLQNYRIRWMGMLSLADSQVAEVLKLDDVQQTAVADWEERIRRNRRGPDSDSVREDAERALRNELSESQYAVWQWLAGQVSDPPTAAPAPPQREANPAPDAPATQLAADRPRGEDESVDPSTLPVDEVQLEMNFQGQPWSEVISWLANEADLSVQTDVSPPGTFTFRDRSRTFSVTEAMDVMNATLLSSGFTMIRSGRILRVVDLESDQEIAGEYIREIADIVDAEELQRRGDYEPVTHYFSLTRLDPAELKPDVEQLISVQGTVVAIPATGELIVTDTAKHVRAIQKMLQNAESSGRGSTVTTLPLKHITADEVLAVARPLLGLEEEANTNDEISISTSAFGSTIYALGDVAKVQILRDLVSGMDVAPSEDEDVVGLVEQLVIRRHRVQGIDLQLAYDVVAQLLAGISPDLKLAKDEQANQLVLFARPSEHKMAEDTLATLAGESSDFEVIQLEKLDTQMAIAAINKFFAITEGSDGSEGQPVIDGDLLARQVWVKGTSTQVEQIRNFIENLESKTNSSNLLGDRIRQFPLTGRSAERAVGQAIQVWNSMKSENRIRVLKSDGTSGSGLPQKSFAPNQSDREARRLRGGSLPTASEQPDPDPSDSAALEHVPEGRLTSFAQQSGQEPSASDTPVAGGDASADSDFRDSDIVIMEGPTGLIISSEDKEALAQFDELLRMVVDASAMGSSEPTIIYLKNIKAEAAKELLETVLSGTADSGGGGGSLLGDMAGSMMGGMFGSLLGGGGGDLLGSGDGIAAGDYTITADPRLNALIVKAGPADMALIEQLLEIFDQTESPVVTETRGEVRMIPVVSKDATEVVTIIKELFGDRIQGASSSGGGGGGGGGRGGQPNPADIINALRGGGRGGRGGGTQSQLTEPKIAISAEPATNMLIVVAQPQDIALVESLVLEIDRFAAKDPEIVSTASLGGKIDGKLFAESITRLLGPQATTNVTTREETTTAGGGDNSSGGDSDSSDAQRQAARAAFFERMRQSGGFGGRGGTPGGGGFGGRGGGGAPSGGGSPFGGGGGRGGGGRGGR